MFNVASQNKMGTDFIGTYFFLSHNYALSTLRILYMTDTTSI